MQILPYIYLQLPLSVKNQKVQTLYDFHQIAPAMVVVGNYLVYLLGDDLNG